MGTKERICGVCLKICDNFKVIGEDIKCVLDIVAPKIDLITAIREPVMCTSCTDILTKCFDFKAVCFHAHDFIVPSAKDKDGVKLDLKEVYHRTSRNGTGISEDQYVCGFCMGPVKNCLATFLDVGEGDLMLKKIIKQCLPELDLSIIKKPVICPSCHGSLEHCFRFVTTCFLTEDKIKKYRDNLDTNSKRGQIELSSLLQFTIEDVIKCEEGDGTVDEIKIEEQFCGEIENASERSINEDTFRLEQMWCEEGKVEIMEQKFLVKEEIKIEPDNQDFNSFQDIPTSSQSITGNINIYDPKDHLVIRQTLSEVRVNNSENMAETKSAHNYRNLSGVTIFKCQSCPFTTKCKAFLKIHLLTHRELSDVKFHMCEICFFVTMLKQNLNSHMLIHPELSEVSVYKCESCSYVAKRKWDLKYHMVTHGEVRDVYTCERCPFITNRKRSLKSHMLTHQELFEVTVYTCESCSFITKHKRSLKVHMLTHRELSEVTVYKCNNCPYITKTKKTLKQHMLTHQELSEATVYRCKSCSYITNRKGNLRPHMLTHQELSEVTVYRCESCSYVTKRKGTLKTTHVDSSKTFRSNSIQMRKLFICNKAKRKFKTSHVNPSETFRSNSIQMRKLFVCNKTKIEFDISHVDSSRCFRTNCIQMQKLFICSKT